MKNMIMLVLTALFLLDGTIGSTRSELRQKLILSSPTGIAHEELTQHAFEIFNHLNDRFVVELNFFPPSRATAEADHGHLDGAALRAGALGDQPYSKNLVKVPTPLVTGILYLLIRSETKEISNWKEDLKGLKVAIRRANPAFQGLVPDSYVIDVTDETQGLKMLQSGRVDAMAISEAAYLGAVIKDPKLGLGIKPSNARMPFQIYIFLHKDRKAIIPDLDAEIQKVVKTGKPQKAWEADIEELKNRADIARKELF